MRKYLVIFAVVLGLAVYVAHQDERTAQESAQKSAYLDKSAIPAKTDEKHPQENVPNTEWHAPSWLVGFFRWPNGTTTWAVILTLMAIAEQTRETAKSAKAAQESAKATRDSILLQEKGMEQWIDVTNWRSEIGEEISELPGGPKTFPLRISVDIVNPTSFPLTLTRSSITFTKMGPGRHGGYVRWGIPDGFFLSPQSPYLISVLIDISAGQYIGGFSRNGLGIEIKGQLSHVGILGKTAIQTLGGILTCSTRETRFCPEVPMCPQEAEPDNENPS